MAERWAERSIADLVLRAWRPFLVNRGPVSQLGYNTNQGNIRGGAPSANQVESGRSGIESIPNPKGCHLLGEMLLKQQLDARRVLRVSLLSPGIFATRSQWKPRNLRLSFGAKRGGKSGRACLLSRGKRAAFPGGTATLSLLADPCVVFVAIDATRFLVLLRVNRLSILLCQVSVILRTHTALFPVDSGLLVFQARSFARGQLAAPDAVGNAALLAGLALVDVIVVCARRGCLGKHCRRRNEESGCKNCRENFHGILLFPGGWPFDHVL